MEFLLQVVGSFIAAVCFGILMNVPRSSLLYGGFAGMVAWTLAWQIKELGYGDVLGTFIGALGAGGISFYFARLKRMPMTVFNIPGIFPLVPGILIYRTVKHFIDGSILIGIESLLHTFVVAFTIGAAMMLVEVVHQIVLRLKNGQKNSAQE